MGLEPMLHACIGVSGVEKRCLGFFCRMANQRSSSFLAAPGTRGDVFTPCIYPGSI